LAPSAQSESEVQVELQAPSTQAHGAHWVVAPTQEPMPSHPAEVRIESTQRFAPQDVPRFGYEHAPPPLQVPPQDPAPKHSSSGSCPEGQKLH
jgi:hypothetical protein